MQSQVSKRIGETGLSFELALTGEFEQTLSEKVLCLAAVVVAGIGSRVVLERFSRSREVVVFEKCPGYI